MANDSISSFLFVAMTICRFALCSFYWPDLKGKDAPYQRVSLHDTLLSSWHITCHLISAGQCPSELGFATTVLARSLNHSTESTVNLILAGVGHETSPLEVRDRK